MNPRLLQMDGEEFIAELQLNPGIKFVFDPHKSDDLESPHVTERHFIVSFEKRSKTFQLFIINKDRSSRFCTPGGDIGYHENILDSAHCQLGYHRDLIGRVIGGGWAKTFPDKLSLYGTAGASTFAGTGSWLLQPFVPLIQTAYPALTQMNINPHQNLLTYVDPTPKEFLTQLNGISGKNLLREIFEKTDPFPATPPNPLARLAAALRSIGKGSF